MGEEFNPKPLHSKVTIMNIKENTFLSMKRKIYKDNYDNCQPYCDLRNSLKIKKLNKSIQINVRKCSSKELLTITAAQ